MITDGCRVAGTEGSNGERKKEGYKGGLQRAKITSYLSGSEEPSTAVAYEAYTYEWNLNKTTKQQEGQSLLTPNEAFSTGNGLHLIALLAKGIPWEPTKTRQHIRLYVALHRQQGCLLKTRAARLSERGDVELAPTQSSPLRTSTFGTGRYLIYSGALHAIHASAMVAQSLWE